MWWGGEVMGQCNSVTVVGDTYSVTVELELIETVVNGNWCPGGFGYETRIGYNVTFTGTNPQMYTLHGPLVCGGTGSYFPLPVGGGSGTVLTSNAAYNNGCGFFPPDPGDFPCNLAQIVFQGRGIAYQTINTSCASILPVEFLSFDASYRSPDRSALLEWATAREWENSHFEIERAVNSVKEWKTVGRVEGSGYSDIPVSYSFYDSFLPAGGGRIFYRIKQVDFDGKSAYSNTRAIEVRPVAGTRAWVAYPNPTDGTDLRLELRSKNPGEKPDPQVILGNTLGQEELLSGESPEEINESLRNALTRRPPGVYLIRVVWGENAEVLRIVKK